MARRRTEWLHTAVWCAVLGCLLGLAGSAAAQQQGRLEEGNGADVAAASRLNVNLEHVKLLRHADELAREGRFDLATSIWQRLLDDGGGSLMTRNEWQTETSDHATYRRYRPVAVELQQTISRLSPQGLGIYRASADVEARAILAAAKGADGIRREAALNELVRRYFLSSLGDDAALELAGRTLDRHDFVGAQRLLNQIDTVFPDPSVSRGEVLLRLAVANAYVGDMRGAQAALARLEQLPVGRPPMRLVEDVRARTLGSVTALTHPQGEGWLMRLGTAAGDGRMAGLQDSYMSGGLSDGWFDELADPARPLASAEALPPGMAQPAMRSPQSMADRSAMLERWQQSTRTPAGQMLVHRGQVFFRTEDRVACRDISTGKLQWLGRENDYHPVVPAMYQVYGWDPRGQMQLRRSRYGAAQGPLSATEIQFLGDRVHASMSIAGDLLLAIEAEPEPATAMAIRQGVFNRFGNQGLSVVRQRENRISAYEVATGKLKWVRPAAEKGPANEPQGKSGFLAAPVPFARQLLVPLVENNSVWLASLDHATGRTTWRTMICEEPEGGAAIWAPIGVAVDGGDVYVATGAGVVAALDAISGSVHWMALYPRKSMEVNPNDPVAMRRRPMSMELPTCWLEDTVIARGSHLIVMPSDADEILSLDRRSGELQWKTPRSPSSDDTAAEYCLGVLGDSLYVAGPRIVRCYSIAGGKPKWSQPLSGSCGRGLLTDGAIYVPDKNEVVKLDTRVELKPGQPRELARSAVVTPSGEPLGNLVTDGRQLLVLGMFRIYALEGMESRLARLAKRISDGDAEARRDRMRLYYRSGRLEEAVADLVAAWSGARPRSAASFGLLLGGIEELELSTSRPEQVVTILAKARQELTADSKSRALLPDQARKLSTIVGSALTALEPRKSGNVPLYLSAAEICEGDYLVDQICRQIRDVVQASDTERLKTAARHPDMMVRRVAVAGLGKARPEASRAALVGAMSDAESVVRMAGAWELANRGDAAALPVLVDLLKAEQPLIRMRAYSALVESTGQSIKYQPHASADARNEAAKAWKQWLDGPGAGVQLRHPLRDAPLGLGRLLLASMGTNQVVELDAQGREIWRTQFAGPYGVHGTADGHRLVANYSARSIHEFDEQGKEIWSVTELSGNPTCVQRLPNGNTLAVLSNRGQVLEIAPDKRIVATQDFGPGVGFARRLENGNTLACLQRQSQVVELDRTGRQVAAFPALNATAARRLDNGNTLIAEQGRNRVIELSPAGQEVWSVNELPGPWDVERLPNGNTIVSNSRGVEEFTPDGRVVRTLNYPSVYRISTF